MMTLNKITNKLVKIAAHRFFSSVFYFAQTISAWDLLCAIGNNVYMYSVF